MKKTISTIMALAKSTSLALAMFVATVILNICMATSKTRCILAGNGGENFVESALTFLIAVVIGALPLLIAAYLSDGFGGGDIKLMAAVGLVLGFECGIFSIMLAFIAELLFYFFYSTTQNLRHRERVKSLPFAPFLAVGVLAVHFINTGGFNLWVF